jgi:hypothetical protein
MAKKKASGVLSVTPEVAVKVDMDAGDLVAIRVAMAEEQLLKKEEDLRGALEQLEADRAEANKAQTKAIEAAQKREEQGIRKKVASTLKEAGFTDLEFRSVIEIGLNKNKELSAKISNHIVVGKGHSTHGIYTKAKAFRMDAKLKKAAQKVEALTKQIQGTTEELRKAKSDLMQMDRVERRAKAELAMQVLQSSAEGRTLLDTLTTQKALPAPK